MATTLRQYEIQGVQGYCNTYTTLKVAEGEPQGVNADAAARSLNQASLLVASFIMEPEDTALSIFL